MLNLSQILRPWEFPALGTAQLFRFQAGWSSHVPAQGLSNQGVIVTGIPAGFTAAYGWVEDIAAFNADIPGCVFESLQLADNGSGETSINMIALNPTSADVIPTGLGAPTYIVAVFYNKVLPAAIVPP